MDALNITNMTVKNCTSANGFFSIDASQPTYIFKVFFTNSQGPIFKITTTRVYIQNFTVTNHTSSNALIGSVFDISDSVYIEVSSITVLNYKAFQGLYLNFK